MTVRRGALLAAVALVAAVAGPLSERASGAGPAVWLPDLVVGWTFVGGGLVAAGRRPRSWTGVLMVATGLAWFVPNVPALLGAATVYLHRGPLVHLLLCHPSGRASSRLTRTAVGAGYVVAVTTLWGQDRWAVALAVLLLAVAVADQRRARGPARRARGVGLGATVVTALVLVLAPLLRLALPGDATRTATRWLVEVTFCLVAVTLAAAVAERQVSVADLVVELGSVRSDQLRDDLARTLGDPGLQIGYRRPDGDGWVDATGRPLSLPRDGQRVTTPVDGPHGPVAVLVHDPAVLDDPALLSGVRAAASLAAAHLQLQAEVQDRVAELAASRRRLLDAADAERSRLDQRLREGALDDLERVGRSLDRAEHTARDAPTRERMAAARSELEETRQDLVRWGRGLHPRELDELGLAGAVRALAERATVATEVRVDLAAPVGPRAAAAAYYVGAEALTNAAKHASATMVTISLRTEDEDIVVEVTDDGAGGAEAEGSGSLRGLRDRVETLGGDLVVESARADGTRVLSRVPLSSG